MGSGLCDKPEAGTITRRTAAPTVAVLLRETGQFPPALDPTGKPVNLSPFRGLTAKQRRERLVGILELLASYGDGAAASEALRHARWEEEMRKGKAPQRVDLNATGDIKVIDTLSAPAGTPIPFRVRPSAG